MYVLAYRVNSDTSCACSSTGFIVRSLALNDFQPIKLPSIVPNPRSWYIAWIQRLISTCEEEHVCNRLSGTMSCAEVSTPAGCPELSGSGNASLLRSTTSPSFVSIL